MGDARARPRSGGHRRFGGFFAGEGGASYLCCPSLASQEPAMSKETKPPVEFALDNRQIFFLFFGLSVVGCFVFALGVMVGRQDLGVPGAQEPLVAEGPTDLDALAGDAIPIEAPDTFAFKDGIAAPATAGLPETRDPDVPPRDEKTVKAEKAAKKDAPPSSKRIAKKPIPAALAKAEPKAETVAVKPIEPAKASAKPEPKADKAESAKPEAKAASTVDDTVMAAGSGETAEAPETKKSRAFTLQLKAYANAEDAEKMAEKLRRNGHDVRVEEGEVKGRTWHRVRIGEFTKWDDALAAKTDFEKAEQIIAYVVPK
jgi:cell division protein FtsN